jgi:hypothetical protein
LASSAFLNWELGAAAPGSNVSEPDDFNCKLLETLSASTAWLVWTVTIAAPITIPNRIETTATRSSRRALAAGQK